MKLFEHFNFSKISNLYKSLFSIKDNCEQEKNTLSYKNFLYDNGPYSTNNDKILNKNGKQIIKAENRDDAIDIAKILNTCYFNFNYQILSKHITKLSRQIKILSDKFEQSSNSIDHFSNENTKITTEKSDNCNNDKSIDIQNNSSNLLFSLIQESYFLSIALSKAKIQVKDFNTIILEKSFFNFYNVLQQVIKKYNLTFKNSEDDVNNNSIDTDNK